MGLDFGSICKIILGFGLGILVISCFVVTVCFGSYANELTAIDKINYRLSFDSSYSMYQCAVAIAVLGCIAAVAALGAIALTIVMDDQTLILIIVGGVSAIFAFGCIVAEGVYTLKNEKLLSERFLENNQFYDRSHKNAQKYIEEAIEDLYGQALDNFAKKYKSNPPTIPSWSTAKGNLGKVDSNGHIYTYGDIWRENSKTGNLTLNINYDNKIIAYFGYSYYTTVGSIKFYHKGSVQYKGRVCWFKNKDKDDIKCKNIKIGKKEEIDVACPIGSHNFLSENIVVGKYYSKADVEDSKTVEDANYLVRNFPFAYHKLTQNEVESIDEKIEEIKEDLDNEDDHDYYSFEDSTKNFKVSGKKYAKACFNIEKKSASEPSEYEFAMAPSKVKDFDDYDKKCEPYYDYDGGDGDDGEYNRNKYQEVEDDSGLICQDTNIDAVWNYVQGKYKDSNKGKIAPSIKKYYLKESRSEKKEYYKHPDTLYTTAMINLVIQILGIIFWACGRFLNMTSGGSDAKTASEGEA